MTLASFFRRALALFFFEPRVERTPFNFAFGDFFFLDWPLVFSPMATACFWDVTFGPVFEPLCSFPDFHSSIVCFIAARLAFLVRGFVSGMFCLRQRPNFAGVLAATILRRPANVAMISQEIVHPLWAQRQQVITHGLNTTPFWDIVQHEFATAYKMTPITAEQCRAARGALKWSAKALASKADLSANTVCTFEQGRAVRDSTPFRIQTVLEAAGIKFTEAGVELTK